MAKVLVTGGSGQVGGALAALLLARGDEVLVPGRGALDLGDAVSIRAYVRGVRPDWIVNPGAYTAVDKAESDRDAAYAVNAVAPGVLGEEARALGAGMIHYSTDYVFPGDGDRPYREEDATGPLGVYGASKLAGEQALAASGAAALTLRTSWVYGATGKNFLLTVLRVAREREQMKIVADQFGAPTSAEELARVTVAIMDAGIGAGGGVYHAAGAGETTWLGFAQEALRLRRLAEPGVKFAELVGIATSEYPTPARRPANSRLDCSKLARVFGVRLAAWEAELARVSARL